MYPLQGSWSPSEYLALNSGLLVEYTRGFVRVLPMPTILHQLIVQFLFRLLDEFVNNRKLGKVLLAPLPVQLGADKYREPDLVFVRPERIERISGYPLGADLVVEVVSDDAESRHRDYVEKRREYAEAEIAEYWIVDPQMKTVVVLTLDGDQYREHGSFAEGDAATSLLLPGLSIDVRAVFSQSI